MRLICILIKIKFILFLIINFSFASSLSQNYSDAYDQHLALHHELALARKLDFQYSSINILRSIDRHIGILDDLDALLLQYNPENIWVIYDIDDCITYPDHPACLPCSYENAYAKIFEELMEDLDPIQKSIVWNLKYRLSENVLTEYNFPMTLQSINNRGVLTMGLTASMAGGVLQLDDEHHKERYKTLSNLGVSWNAPKEEILLDEFPSFHRSCPIYYHGLGFSQTSGDFGSTTKGEFLLALMKRWNIKPSCVLFIDDSPTNLRRFSHVMDQNGIDCFCYLYRSPLVHEVQNITEKKYKKHINKLISLARRSTSYF